MQPEKNTVRNLAVGKLWSGLKVNTAAERGRRLGFFSNPGGHFIHTTTRPTSQSCIVPAPLVQMQYT